MTDMDYGLLEFASKFNLLDIWIPSQLSSKCSSQREMMYDTALKVVDLVSDKQDSAR